MATCPPSLTWMLVKDQNAFMHKRNGQTARAGVSTAQPFVVFDEGAVLMLVIIDDQEHGVMGLLSSIEHGSSLLSGFVHRNMFARLFRSSCDPGLMFGHQLPHLGDETGLGLVVAGRLLHFFLNGVEASVEPLTCPNRIWRAHNILAFHAFAQCFNAVKSRTCFGVVRVSF